MLSFALLFSAGALFLAFGGIGLWRGRVVAIPQLAFARAERPAAFWYGIGFHFLIGLVCVLAAVDELVPFGYFEFLGGEPDAR